VGVCGEVGARERTRGQTFGVLEMDDVAAGVVGSVVADVAEVGAAVGRSESAGACGRGCTGQRLA